MATISLFNNSGVRRRSSGLRSYTAAIACVAGIGVATTATPAVAQPAAFDAQQLAALLNNPAAPVADLAVALAGVQEQVATIEQEIGQHREAMNKALVDLQDARTELSQAQAGTLTARQQLDAAQAAVEAAQAKLNELARSTYRRSATSGAVATAAGADNREAVLERQTFLRSQISAQQEIVTELERDRTEKANKESQLRKVEQLTEQRAASATQAEQDARTLLNDSEDAIAQALAQREQLLAQQTQAQRALDAARGVVAAPVASAETTVVDVPAEAAVANDVANAPVPEFVAEPVAAAVADAPQAETAQGPSVFEQAANIIAATQPVHAELAQMAGSSEGQLSAIQGFVQAVAEASVSEKTQEAQTEATPTQPATANESDLVSELSGVLTTLDTTDTVTEKASALVASEGTNAQIEAVIARAQSQIGVPYAWGGGDANGPTKGIRDGGVADSYGDYNKVGFDCSGLTLYAFAAAGISLPHYTGYQYNMGTKVDPSNMKRGDLIFYGPGGSQHVAIYLGDGTMIEAPQSGSTVQVSPVRYAGMTPQVVRLIG